MLKRNFLILGEFSGFEINIQVCWVSFTWLTESRSRLANLDKIKKTGNINLKILQYTGMTFKLNGTSHLELDFIGSHVGTNYQSTKCRLLLQSLPNNTVMRPGTCQLQGVEGQRSGFMGLIRREMGVKSDQTNGLRFMWCFDLRTRRNILIFM